MGGEVVKTEAILALISDLYTQVAELQSENMRLRSELKNQEPSSASDI